ncbi:MAG: hypothetical protein ACM3NH_04150, partial [Candidatus Saccharibacteria bacterium]
KRSITTGALVTAFDSDGVLLSDPTSGSDDIYAIAVDSSYVYLAGVQPSGCSAGSYCWRLEKHDKTTGALVTAFDTDGIVQSDPTNSLDYLYAIALDSSYIYLGGHQSTTNCSLGGQCWRIEKRDITTGALVTAFDSDGYVISDPGSSNDYVNSIAVDASYLYIGGYQYGDCSNTGNCWRLEKRDKTTGALVTAFDTDGVVQSDPGADDELNSIALDSSYIYLAGIQETTGCALGMKCWRLEKRSITTGALVTAFDSDGVMVTDPTASVDTLSQIAIDSSYIYLGGHQYIDCAYGGYQDCYRIEKREIATGALVTDFGTNGMVLGEYSPSYDQVYAMAIDSSYMYLGGLHNNATGRLEKRNLSTGALVDGSAGTSLTAGNLDINGSFVLTGGTFTSTPKTLMISGNLTGGGTFNHNKGTVELDGTSDQSVPGFSYYNLKINKSSGAANLTGALSVEDVLTVVSGTLGAPTTLTLNGDFINNGTFTSNSGTVVINPTKTIVTIGGSSNTNFYNLTINKGAAVINFGAGRTFGVNGALNLQGQSGRPLVLASDTPGTMWRINFTGTSNISFVTIKDAGCSGGNNISLSESVNNAGNIESCWKIPVRGGSIPIFAPIDNGLAGGTPTTGGSSQGGGNGSTGDAVAFSDAFTGADSTLLSSHDSRWVLNTGSAYQLSSNGVVGAEGSGNGSMANWNASTDPNQYAKGVFGAMTHALMGVAVRVNPSTSNGYYFFASDIESYFGKLDGTTWTDIPDGASRGAFSAGDTIEIRAQGSTIKLYKNGAQIGSDIVDTTYATGNVGIASYNSAFYGSSRLDSWEGGPLSGASQGGGTAGGTSQGGGGGAAP